MDSRQFQCYAKDGIRLHVTEWTDLEPKGVVCVVHGLGEYGGRYEHAADALLRKGYAVMAADLRGHGRSEGKRGHAPSLDILLDDMSLLMEQASNRYKGVPVFLYGHSMGGGLTLNYILRRHPTVAGAVVTSPWLKLSVEPPMTKRFFAFILDNAFPAITQKNGLNSDWLSHDAEIGKAYMNDPLVHHSITVRLFSIMQKSAVWAVKNADRLSVPLLLMHGSEDPITSPQGSREFASRAGKLCELIVWNGLYHELHNEVEKDKVMGTITEWLVRHT